MIKKCVIVTVEMKEVASDSDDSVVQETLGDEMAKRHRLGDQCRW